MAEAQGENVTPEKDPGLQSFDGFAEEELAKRILALVEFYLSNEHILYNQFLLKTVLKNSEGYISLKLIASFRKVKSIGSNLELVRKALRSSTKLELNAEGDKVRRRAPLPENAKTVASRTVVIYPLPDEILQVPIETVIEMFSPCGPISFLGLLQSGGVVPHCARQFRQRHPDMGRGKVGRGSAAVVEFGQHQGVNQALSLDNPYLRFLPLVPNPRTARDLVKTGTAADARRPAVPSQGAVSQSTVESLR